MRHLLTPKLGKGGEGKSHMPSEIRSCLRDGRRAEAEHPSIAATQHHLRAILGELRRLDDRLTDLCEALPEPGAEFEALGELRGRIECLQSDLLLDAMATLWAGASRSEAELYEDFLWRRKRLRVVGGQE